MSEQPVSEFDDLDDAPPPPNPWRVSVLWVWLFVVGCFLALGAVLFFQYDVWVHPIHEPTEMELVEADLNVRFGGHYQIISSQPMQVLKEEPLLRVKYRQRGAGGRWIPVERIYCIRDGQVLWSKDYEMWKLDPDG